MFIISYIIFQLEIILNKPGPNKITLASCTCPAGLVRCHHMATVLFHIVQTVSCTDLECIWTRRGNLTDEPKCK